MYFSSIWILFGSNLSYQACCAQDFCKFLSASIAVVPTVPMSCSVLDFFFFWLVFSYFHTREPFRWDYWSCSVWLPLKGNVHTEFRIQINLFSFLSRLQAVFSSVQVWKNILRNVSDPVFRNAILFFFIKFEWKKKCFFFLNFFTNCEFCKLSVCFNIYH